MDEPETVQCPECDAWFYVVWNRGYETMDGVQFCPFCGEEIDYTALQSQEPTL